MAKFRFLANFRLLTLNKSIFEKVQRKQCNLNSKILHKNMIKQLNPLKTDIIELNVSGLSPASKSATDQTKLFSNKFTELNNIH